MVQVKKEAVRQALLDSACDLFSERGYHATTLAQIAKGAGVGVGSFYSYFDSKIRILYEIFEPWQAAAYDDLEDRIARLSSPRPRLRALLLGVWRDIPERNIGLANSLMEALSAADPDAGKPTDLLARTEQRLAGLLARALPGTPPDQLSVLPKVIIMAYDGFVINRRLGDDPDFEKLADGMCDLILSHSPLPVSGA
ncbi:TetR/AcrR family transcriptional regulator [Chachezhania sediminis]|uniref:TetR/AcrR family transcriptional regulator n=1 Tax=Chachezhania sediminis TaxID=2599291 RepID=UPI00131AEA96|nr:TetR/AcrR family transcriptional regulator [Chachezhania sediminis]